MKITKSKLKQLIKEELRRDLREVEVDIANITHENLADVRCDDLLELYKQALEHEEEAIPEIVGAIEARMDDCDNEEADPRSSLGGMVDVDYDDPIVGRRGNLEEKKITKSQLKQIIKEELSEALPPHLQSKVDAYEKKKQKFSITDRTPPGYGPDDDEEEPLRLGSPSQYGTGEDPLKRDPPSALRRKALRKERNEKLREDRFKHLEE